jgi:hypothetical protein
MPPPPPTLPDIKPDTPRNYLERGVYTPFTTPMLMGARLRYTLPDVSHQSEQVMPSTLQIGSKSGPRPRIGNIEIIVPNPTGLRGVYILSWRDIGALCQPTIHDVHLCETLAQQTDPTHPLKPSDLRRAALETASRGLAGKASQQAAKRITEEEHQQLAATRLALLLNIIRQTEKLDQNTQHPIESHEALEARAGRALSRLAGARGEPPARLMKVTDHISTALLDIGVGPTQTSSRIAMLIGTLETLHGELGGMADSGHHDGVRMAIADTAAVIRSSVEIVARTALANLGSMQLRMGDISSFIRDWIANPQELQTLAERPSWVLDGWEQIAMLWQLAPMHQPRLSTLQEMAAQLPVWPDEADQWLGLSPGTTSRLNAQATQIALEWRSSVAPQNSIARNEHLRAIAG